MRMQVTEPRSVVWSYRIWRQAKRAMLAVFLGIVTTAAFADVPMPTTPDRYAVNTEQGGAAVREKYGIEIQPIRISGAGYMLDFRYRVVDAEKAAAIHKAKLKPYVLDAEEKWWSGVPATKVGSLRQTKQTPREGVVYTTMLANPGRYFQSGDTVSVVLGRLVLDHMVIQ